MDVKELRLREFIENNVYSAIKIIGDKADIYFYKCHIENVLITKIGFEIELSNGNSYNSKFDEINDITLIVK